jgi:hypothetical protein
MAIPAAASAWSQPMDPSDRVDYRIDLVTAGLLGGGEQVDSYTLTLLPEAVALGLTILEDIDHGPFDDGTSIHLWLEVVEAFRTNTAFNAGVNLPMELTVETTSTPPRRLQRTIVVRVVHL